LDHREMLMRQALELARQAQEHREVPVGCVITGPDGTVLAEARNRCHEDRDATAHAEMLAIRQAQQALGSAHLEGCTLTVTLEPCPMCAGAILQTRISSIVFGARDPAAGSCGSVLNLFEERYGHHPAIYGSVLEEECSRILSDFFRSLREQEDVTC